MALVLSACRPENPTGSIAPPTSTPQTNPAAPTISPTRPEPSPTTEPLAARVDGRPITLAEYEAELGRFQAAAGHEPTGEDRQMVLDYLVDQALLAQAAEKEGFQLPEADLQARLDTLAEQAGGQARLEEWLKANNFSEAGFRQQLAVAAAASWMRDLVAAAVPTTGEQVHVRQILSRTEVEAAAILAQLQNGADFAELALAADPQTGGELGWVGRGTLYDPKLEEASFALQPGEFSPVIETLAGFHILQVIEREAERPLEPQALLAAQKQAVLDWLAERRQQSQVEILIPK